jgi:hypothetical protein
VIRNLLRRVIGTKSPEQFAGAKVVEAKFAELTAEVKLAGTGSSVARRQKTFGSLYRQQSCELSTAEPREAKPLAILDSGGVFRVIQHSYPAQ